MRLFSKRNFWAFVFRRSPLFAAFARKWGGEKKGRGEKHSPDLQEPTLNCLVASERSEAAPSPLWLKTCVNPGLPHLIFLW